MPLLKTTKPCLYMEADAYILIHDGSLSEDFLFRRICRRAGPQLLEAYESSGILPYGDPVITPGFGLSAKYVIHILQPKPRENDWVTIDQYINALSLAQAYGCESVVFAMPSSYDEAMNVNAVCRAMAQKTDMTIYQSGGSERNTALSFDILRRLKKLFAGERADYGREITEIHSAYEAYVSPEDTLPEDTRMSVAECQAFFESRREQEKTADYGIRDEDAAAPSCLPQAAPPQALKPQLSELKDASARPEKKKAKNAFWTLQEFLKKNDAGFKDTLLKYIDRTGKKDSEIYKKANIDRRLFSKIMNVEGYNPSKPTAIAFAIALELNLEETKDLIGRAGYTLSQASTFDRIIEFFIMEKNYDIYEINEALFYFDQSLLGC